MYLEPHGCGAAPAWSLQVQLRRWLLGLLAGLWLAATVATGLGLWHETDEALDSALTETAQRLLLLPEAALAEPDTAESLVRLGAHDEYLIYQVFGADVVLRLRRTTHRSRRWIPTSTTACAAPDPGLC